MGKSKTIDTAAGVAKVLEERQRTRLTATLEEIAKQRGRPTPKFILDLLEADVGARYEADEADAVKFTFAGVDMSAGLISATFTSVRGGNFASAVSVVDNAAERGTFANTAPSYPYPYTAPPIDDAEFKKTIDTLRDNLLAGVSMPPAAGYPGCDCAICRGPFNVVPTARHELATVRARTLERTVSLKHFPIAGTSWRIVASNGQWLEDVINLDLTLPVLDRETGAPRAQSFTMNVPIRQWIERPVRAVAGELATGLRKFILDALSHEVDESIHVGTERVFDPHRPLDMVGAAVFGVPRFPR